LGNPFGDLGPLILSVIVRYSQCAIPTEESLSEEFEVAGLKRGDIEVHSDDQFYIWRNKNDFI